MIEVESTPELVWPSQVELGLDDEREDEDAS